MDYSLKINIILIGMNGGAKGFFSPLTSTKLIQAVLWSFSLPFLICIVFLFNIIGLSFFFLSLYFYLLCDITCTLGIKGATIETNYQDCYY